MSFRVIDRGRLDIAAWGNLMRHGSFFHTASWVDICLAGLPTAHRAVFLCGYEGDELIAGMPGLITRRFGFETFYSMPDGTYGAPVFSAQCPEGQRREFLESLTAYFREESFSGIIIADFEGSLRDWPGYKMRRTRHFTHIIALDNPDDYRPRANIESDLRTGQKRPSEIIRFNDISQVDDFYRLYRLTRMRHKGGPDRGKKFFESIFQHLAKTDKLYWIGLKAEGSMIASHIYFIHGDTLFGWQVVSDYEKRHYKPNQLLTYDAIGMAGKNGLRKINLGASPPEAEGLVFYKEHWQGIRIEYDILTARSWWRNLLGR